MIDTSTAAVEAMVSHPACGKMLAELLAALVAERDVLAARAEAAERIVERLTPPDFQRGQRVRVEHKRFRGFGVVDRCEVMGKWHHIGWCPKRGWLVPVKLENGNTWCYEADTVSEAAAKGKP